MLPLRDENPTHRRPIVTLALIAICLWVYFGWQPSLGTVGEVAVETAAGPVIMDEATAFNFERAAIPCEISQMRPLSVEELVETARSTSFDVGVCSDDAGTALFPEKSIWLALFTSMFLHGSIAHLLGNLWFLWIFGNNIEDHLGHVRYLVFYVVGGLVATFGHIALNLDSTIPVVGASGAIAAVMGAYLVWFPDAPVRTGIILVFFIQIIDVRAKWLLGFWLVSQFFTNPNSGVAWAAHVGGFVFGVIIGLIVRRSRRVRDSSWTPEYRIGPGSSWDTTGGAGYHPYGRRRIGRGDH